MRNLVFVPLLLLALHAAAQAAVLQLDITYTDGQILSGPLSADLDVLPASVQASFRLNGSSAGVYNLGDVSQASLTFGDGVWTVGDLQSFATTLLSTDSGGLAVAALSYALGPIDTSTVSGRLAANFPLEIQGTDLASGDEFHYQYDTSIQTVTVQTVVPEPSSIALAAFGFAGIAVWGWRRRRRICVADGDAQDSHP